MKEHTPGSWTIDSECPGKIIGGEFGGLVAETSTWWFDPETANANAEHIVKACNHYAEFVELAHMVAGRMYNDGVGRHAVQLAEKLLDGLGIERWHGPRGKTG